MRTRYGSWVSILVLASALLGCVGPTLTGSVPTSTPDYSKLEGTKWQLSRINGQPIIDGTQITVDLQAGILVGSAGCNRYGGGPDSGGYWATSSGELRVPVVAVTLNVCTAPVGIMEQEWHFLDDLNQITRYERADQSLTLLDADGTVRLEFVASSP